MARVTLQSQMKNTDAPRPCLALRSLDPGVAPVPHNAWAFVSDNAAFVFVGGISIDIKFKVVCT